jgi:uncharacterized protein YndB with AHSA1/START domain
MSDQRIEVSRTIEAPASVIFSLLCDPAGHVKIDASGMLMSCEGTPVTRVGDTFLVHMDREALNDIPLGKYSVSIRITEFERDRRIAWTIEHPMIDPPMGYVYGYSLEPVESGTVATSYCDWSNVHEKYRTQINFPIVPESSLRATLGILARTVSQEVT